jgi:hypothetical protein
MDPEDELDETLLEDGDEGQEGDGPNDEPEEGQGSDAPVGDEGEGDGEGGTQESVRAEPRQVSRGESRFQKLANEAREAREEAARVSRELNELKQAQQREQQREREPSAEEMALWTPEQRSDYKLEKATRGFTAAMQQVQLQSADLADKSSFDMQCATQPLWKKYSGEVEKRLADLRKQGQSAPREAILKFILGEKLLTGGGKARTRQAQQGQRRIQRQQGADAPPRSDTGGGRRQLSEAEKRAKRLENVTF